MDASKAGTRQAAAQRGRAPRARGRGSRAVERARARAYLDLWERHVVHVALYGPARAGRPPTSDRPRATRRRTARRASPLIFHLGAALAAYAPALLAAPRADSPAFPGSPGSGWTGAMADLDQWRSRARSRRGCGRRSRDRDPAAPSLPPHARGPAGDLAGGSSRLLDYGRAPEATRPDGPPSSSSRASSTAPTSSTWRPGARCCAGWPAQGFRPLLVDWGTPGPAEAGFDLAAYGSDRLVPALSGRSEIAGRPGAGRRLLHGRHARGRARRRRPTAVAALATIGAPWDFASIRGVAGGYRAAIRAEGAGRAAALLDAQAQAFGMVPVSLFQFLFTLVNPLQAALKFQKLARLDPDGPAARLFVALEDWLADGVPMPAGAAKDLLLGFAGDRNRTAARRVAFSRRRWSILAGSPRRRSLLRRAATPSPRRRWPAPWARPCRGPGGPHGPHRPRGHDRRQCRPS